MLVSRQPEQKQATLKGEVLEYWLQQNSAIHIMAAQTCMFGWLFRVVGGHEADVGEVAVAFGVVHAIADDE
jgi:hypothetical protein